ncbi:NAD(P)H-dependent flavin oxidoreductase [Klebsiella pneumoniae]|uniref:NAD(P)H-dependent flavin oxidoreductase n=1 Tax=Klebsiella pneumoniae TaxID=573 RepID=UPI0021D9A3D8|nr:nitronate monooxygenase [Klebsiella pneumoniae]MCU8607381.1 nitronate monooxygenase [Klebsiella pneumoniae]
MQPNRVARILGIEKPVVQGPLSWLTDARLVAAVGNAGGLGVLGPNAGLTAATAVSPEATAEKMREEIRKTKQLTEKPFGVNLIPTAENDIWTPAILPVIKEEGVKVVVYTGYGDGSLKPALFDELKAAGITIIYRDINPTPENSRRAEQAGADIIVATGFDEGGTLPGTALGTFTIVPLIVDAVQRVPVMAAGGITDARGARAVHALGAEGVFAGSVFISTIESRVPDSVKAKIVAANGLDLRLFRTLPDYYRALPGKLSDTLVAMDRAGASRTELAQAMGGLRGMRLGMLEGNTDEGYISVGAGIGNIHAITSVAEVVNQLAV